MPALEWLDSPGPEKSPADGAGAWPSWAETVPRWFGDHERSVRIAAVVLQVLILFGMMVPRGSALLTGETVLLRVVPVDPRDLLRGDYVILGYEISRVPPGGIQGLGSFDEGRGQTVYVTLIPEPDGQHYRGGGMSTQPPPPGVRFIRGTLTGPARIEFGIESYFVQEGKGKEYEDAIRSRRLSAEVALTPDGRAALRGLRIE